MRFDRRAVERQRHAILIVAGQCAEYLGPTPALRPAIEAIVDRRIGTILARTITPTPARLKHVHDAADDTSIIHTFRPGQTAGKMRFDAPPLPVIQPEQALPHDRLAPNQLDASESFGFN